MYSDWDGNGNKSIEVTGNYRKEWEGIGVLITCHFDQL